VDRKRAGEILEVIRNIFWILQLSLTVMLTTPATAGPGLGVEWGRRARPRLCWYNGRPTYESRIAVRLQRYCVDLNAACRGMHSTECVIVTAVLSSRCGYYILPSGYYLPSSVFFPRLISAVADWMSTILPHMVWP